MEEKKSIKISLSFILLVIAIMVIILLVFCLYFQKTSYNQQIATLENNIYEMTMNSSSMQNRIDDLQGKLGSIANIINEETNPVNSTTENAVTNEVTNTVENTATANTVKEDSTEKTVDYVLSLDEIEVATHGNDQDRKAFYSKYGGKYVKVTGYAVDIGRDTVSFGSLSYYINLSKENVKDMIYVCGYTEEAKVFEELKQLSPNQKVTIYGTVYSGNWPPTLTEITIEK